MNFKALRAFQLIAERGSLSAAAGDLCLSQPAVSRLIAQLESELDLRLFDRSGRGLSMSKEGRAFYDSTKQILAGVDEIPRIAKDIRSGDRSLQLLTTPHVAQAVISPALALMRQENTPLRCRVDVRASVDLDDPVCMRRFDMAVGPLPATLSTTTHEMTPLFKVRTEAVLPKNHRLLARAHLTASDLAGEELIGPWHDPSWRRQMSDFLPSRGETGPYVVETHSSLIACQMASDGAGIALLDRLSARGLDLQVEFRPLEPARWTTFGYMHQRGETMSPAAVGLIEAVRKTISAFAKIDVENSNSVSLIDA